MLGIRFNSCVASKSLHRLWWQEMQTIFDRAIFPVNSSVGEQNLAIAQWVFHLFRLENFHRNNVRTGVKNGKDTIYNHIQPKTSTLSTSPTFENIDFWKHLGPHTTLLPRSYGGKVSLFHDCAGFRSSNSTSPIPCKWSVKSKQTYRPRHKSFNPPRNIAI